MKFFITGATGFIGKHLCKRLIADGHEIVALARSPEKAKKLPQEIQILKGDLSVFKQTGFLIPECDVVIHLAGVIGAKSETEYFQYNYHSTVDFIECLKRQHWKPKRFLYTSSLAAAGPSPNEIPLTEEMNPNPVEPYGKAKLKSEEFLQSCTFPVTSFRPGIVLGEGDKGSFILFKMAKKRMGMRVAGMNQKVSCVDVEDLTDAIVKMTLDDSMHHRTYFTVHPQIVSMNMLWDALDKALVATLPDFQKEKKMLLIPIPKSVLFASMLISTISSKIFSSRNKIDYKMYVQMTQKAFICSSGKIQKELNWQPKHDIYAMTKRAAEGYRKMGRL